MVCYFGLVLQLVIVCVEIVKCFGWLFLVLSLLWSNVLQEREKEREREREREGGREK